MTEHPKGPGPGPAIATAGIFLAGLVLFAPEAAPVHPPFLPPGAAHFLGTDNIGRDLLALLVRAAGLSLAAGAGAGLGATALGAVIGCLAGYGRPAVDDFLMRLTDFVLLIPGIPLMVILAAYAGPGLFNVVLVIALTSWPSTARVIRAHVLKLRDRPFVAAAQSMGGKTGYVIFRHILPNCAQLLLAKASLAVAGAMLAEAGISFLGLGDPEAATWGGILHDAFGAAALINGYWWWYLPPVLAISAAVILLNLLGHALFGGGTDNAEPAGFDAGKGHEGAKDRDRIGNEAGLLAIRGLRVSFGREGKYRQRVLAGIDLDLARGQKLTMIGETGSGKSVLLLAVLGLLPVTASVRGRLAFEGRDLSTLDEVALRRFRGLKAAYVPQGLGDALNPVISVGRQIAERLHVHCRAGAEAGRKRAATLLAATGIADSKQRARDFPHQFSGGMKQRALLAMAMAASPPLLLADEPTKGLNADAVDAVLEIFLSLKTEAVLTITHDLDFAQRLGGNVAVMYAGRIMETGPAASFFARPRHPYSRALLAARPAMGLRVDSGPAGNRQHGGCPYRHRCPWAGEQCRKRPALFQIGSSRVRCWRYAP